MIKEFYREGHDVEKIIDYEIYTDGSCKSIGMKTFGAWGFVVVHDDKKIFYKTGGETDTTNQRMELLAVVEALRYIAPLRTEHQRVKLFSDSAYVINCYTQRWFDMWLRNGWTNSSGKAVAHKELWEEIIPFFDHWWYSFTKVKGHANIYWNEMCDQLVQEEADKLKHNWRVT